MGVDGDRMGDVLPTLPNGPFTFKSVILYKQAKILFTFKIPLSDNAFDSV